MFVSTNISGLLPGATFHYRVKAENALGTTYGNDLTFKILGLSPTVISIAATNVQLNTATINGSVNPNYLSTIVIFEWGTSINYENSVTATQSPLTGNSSVNVSAGLTGLLPGITYHFRVKAENALGIKIGRAHV